MRDKTIKALFTVICLSGSASVLADWQDWWQTPEQQAAEAFEQADHERLLQKAPDAGWAGLGHYQAGDYDAAAEAFAERAGQLQQQGEAKAANQALYNQGVSDVWAGRYQEAIERFDTVLDSDPSFADAAHNRDIARQLLQRQQEQQSQSQSDDAEEPGEEGQQGEGEPGQQGDQQPSGKQEQADDQKSSGNSESADEEQGESAQDSSAESPAAERDGSESGESADENQAASGAQSGDDAPGETQAERQAAAEAAQRALDAEAQRAQDQSGKNRSGAGEIDERPLSESEQATEQLLRRIPDDPAGLLRRRLEQSHRIEYPEVRDGREAW